MARRAPTAGVILGLVIILGLVPGVAGAAEHTGTTEVPGDPETDVIGWEDGYWHNETLRVDPDDGFNETEVNMTVARAMARVERIRGLEFNETVTVEIVSREAYRNQSRDRPIDPSLRRFDNAKFEALFLVNESSDSIEVQGENRGEGDQGFYNFAEDRIVLVSPEDDGTVTMNELTLAHELVHALQDQHYNLSRYRASTRDEANGLNGLIEGDASYVEHEYRQRCGDRWECHIPGDDGVDSGGRIANLGVYAVMIQPYSDGPSFVQSLVDRGGWEAVDAAYDRPPVSSEQIIHPSRYPEGVPANVTLEDRAREPWTRVRPPDRPAYGTLGEASLVAMMVYPLYDDRRPFTLRRWIIEPDQWFNRDGDGLNEFDPLNYQTDYTDGWEGDRLHVYANPDGETAYVWRLHWSTEADANEFVEGYRWVLSYWGADRVGPNTWAIEDGGFSDAFRVIIRGRTVTVINAPTQTDLDLVWPTSVSLDQTQSADGSNGTRTAPETRIPPTATGPSLSDPTPADTSTAPGQPGFGLLAGLSVVVLLVVIAAKRRG